MVIQMCSQRMQNNVELMTLIIVWVLSLSTEYVIQNNETEVNYWHTARVMSSVLLVYCKMIVGMIVINCLSIDLIDIVCLDLNIYHPDY